MKTGPSPFSALLLYSTLTVVMTWPLSAGIAHDVPGDLGDSLLNMWILWWVVQGVPRIVLGDLRGVWDANIFHPEPLTLGFSEHLFGQALQVFPFAWMSDNVILWYNLLFLSSFVLSGAGMFLLVRDITGNPRAALIAGLFYAFVPYRIAQIPHIQVLSSQWMPFALYGFRRFIVSDAPHFTPARLLPLAIGGAALLLQNWSNVYYLVFFAPFVLLFVLHQIVANGRATDWRLWGSFAAAAIVVFALNWPFLALYLETQRVHAFERSIGEVIGFSADAFGYLTASQALRVAGPWLQAAPRPEGELFLGFTPALLAVAAVATLAITAARREVAGADSARWRLLGARVMLAIALVQLTGFVAVCLTGGFITHVAGVTIRANHAGRLLLQTVIAIAIAALLSPRVRMAAVHALRSPITLAACLFGLAVVLSLGPSPRAGGQPIPGLGLYAWLYEHAPGFSGLRVPSRLAMVAALFLSLLAGLGAAEIGRRFRFGVHVLAVAALAFVVEAWAAPIPVSVRWDSAAHPPGAISPYASAPPVYRLMNQDGFCPRQGAVAEFPFGDPEWELRYVYYAGLHRRPILNGYSGGFPQGYRVRAALLQRFAEQPDAAWRALVDAGTACVVVHARGFSIEESTALDRWLTSHGARRSAVFDTDAVYTIERK